VNIIRCNQTLQIDSISGKVVSKSFKELCDPGKIGQEIQESLFCAISWVKWKCDTILKKMITFKYNPILTLVAGLFIEAED